MLGFGSYESAWYRGHSRSHNNAEQSPRASRLESLRSLKPSKAGVAPEANPPGKIVRRVEEARPGAMATEPIVDSVMEAILDANPEAMWKHQAKAPPRAAAEMTYG
jgi:hypothetical protein